mmetsp:Transcript_18859/g.25580  ORF Transcript_18859/g.25580 Transcript_18859/m.25580 type:complete len:99 (+) Transcript_18859:342-638(+)
MQYLRSSLTVPLHFERREKIESRRFERVNELNAKSKCISWAIFIIQIIIIPLYAFYTIYAYTNYSHFWFWFYYGQEALTIFIYVWNIVVMAWGTYSIY